MIDREKLRKKLHGLLHKHMIRRGTYPQAAKHLQALAGSNCEPEVLLFPIVDALSEMFEERGCTTKCFVAHKPENMSDK